MTTQSMISKDVTTGWARPAAGPSWLGVWIADFRARLERRRIYWDTVAKLSALDDELLADIGVGRGQIELVAERLAVQATHRR